MSLRADDVTPLAAAPTHSDSPSVRPTPSPSSILRSQARSPAKPWIVAENHKRGTSAWRIKPGTPKGIDGYANTVSAQRGDSVKLYVDTRDRSFRVEAYRLGYYQGLGGRLVYRSPKAPGTRQPAPTIASDTNMVSTRWSHSITLSIGARWVEGTYLLKLVGSDGAESYVPLVIRNDASTAALVIQHEVTTWEAYNTWGGASLYAGPDGNYASRSRVVSFDRPYAGRGANGLLNELPYISLVEKLGLDVTYSTDVDLDREPALLRHHDALISLDHDEYWSTSMRNGVEAARAHGVNLAFLGANAMYRHIRFASSRLGRDRLVICYKDPTEDPLYGVRDAGVTTNWRAAPLNRPESEILGPMYECNPVDAPLVVSSASSFVFAGTRLSNGSTLPDGVEMEYDTVYPYEPTPRTLQILAHSPVQCGGMRSYADMTYYAARSGAGVFDAASQGWVNLVACGHPVDEATCNHRAVRITENVLRQFAHGPAGRRHPSKPNLGRFGISLQDPTTP